MTALGEDHRTVMPAAKDKAAPPPALESGTELVFDASHKEVLRRFRKLLELRTTMRSHNITGVEDIHRRFADFVEELKKSRLF